MALGFGVGSKGTTASNTTIATGAVTTQTAGSLTIGAEIFQSTQTFSTIVDSKSNTYTILGAEQGMAAGTGKCRMYYKENAVGGSSHTLTVTNAGAANPITALFAEFTGAMTVGALDGTVQQVNDASSPFTLAITPSAGNRVLVALFAGDSGSNPATNAESSGFTIISAANETNGASFWTGCLAYKIVVGDGSTAFTASFTETGATSCGIILAAFKEAPSGGSWRPSTTMGPGNHPGARRFRPIARGWPSMAVGGDVTVALTGSAIAYSTGTLATTRDVPLVGQAYAWASGTLTPNNAVSLSGAVEAYSTGTLTPNTDVSLAGATYAWNTGTLTASTGGDVTVALTGSLITFATDAMAPSTSVALTGSSESYATGSVAIDHSQPLTGVAEAYSTGVLTPSTTISLAGSLIAFDTGTMSANAGGDVTVALTGSLIQWQAGQVTPGGGDDSAVIQGGLGRRNRPMLPAGYLYGETDEQKRRRRIEQGILPPDPVPVVAPDRSAEIARVTRQLAKANAEAARFRERALAAESAKSKRKLAEQQADAQRRADIAAADLAALEFEMHDALEQQRQEGEQRAREIEENDIAYVMSILASL